VLASATIMTKLFSNISKNIWRREIKMDDVCKQHCKDNYFEIPVWEKLILPMKNTFY
jgi:hypothetical protein